MWFGSQKYISLNRKLCSMGVRNYTDFSLYSIIGTIIVLYIVIMLKSELKRLLSSSHMAVLCICVNHSIVSAIKTIYTIARALEVPINSRQSLEVNVNLSTCIIYRLRRIYYHRQPFSDCL